MEATLKQSIWQQFGAAIDMFSDAVELCPEELWTTKVWDDEDDPRYGQFWFVAYHTVMWFDLYLDASSPATFQPPEPFMRSKLPDEPYTKEQIAQYLKQSRQKCQQVIEGLTDETAYRICTYDWMTPTFLELQIYSMRHIQEHAGQLNLVLGLQGVTGMDWVSKARD